LIADIDCIEWKCVSPVAYMPLVEPGFQNGGGELNCRLVLSSSSLPFISPICSRLPPHSIHPSVGPSCSWDRRSWEHYELSAKSEQSPADQTVFGTFWVKLFLEAECWYNYVVEYSVFCCQVWWFQSLLGSFFYVFGHCILIQSRGNRKRAHVDTVQLIVWGHSCRETCEVDIALDIASVTVPLNARPLTSVFSGKRSSSFLHLCAVGPLPQVQLAITIWNNECIKDCWYEYFECVANLCVRRY